MTITCQDRDRIFRDGLAEELAGLEAHAANCAACAEELHAWKQLSEAAAELRDYREAPALWTRIESSLREQQSARAGHWEFWQRLDFLPRIPQAWQFAVVGALAILLAVSGGYLYIHRTPAQPASANKLLRSDALAEVEKTEREYMAAIDKLASEAGPQLQTDTPLMANYREKLLVLDSAIAELRGQAGDNPSNAHLHYQLLAMYQEKQQTLEDILETKR